MTPLHLGATYREKYCISKEQIETFGRLSGDLNPVHFDDEAAKALGFDGAISHGMLSVSIFSKILGMRFPGSGTVYLNQTFSYRKPIYASQQLQAVCTVASIEGRRVKIQTQIFDAAEKLLVDGVAEVLLPKA